jgi:hypothetical protein
MRMAFSCSSVQVAPDVVIKSGVVSNNPAIECATNARRLNGTFMVVTENHRHHKTKSRNGSENKPFDGLRLKIMIVSIANTGPKAFLP